MQYLLSRTIVELPYILIIPLIMILVVYWFVGLSNTAEQFFTAYLIGVLTALCGNSMGFLTGIIVQNAKTIQLVTDIWLQPVVVFAGFYKNRSNFADWIGWIEYLSPIKYSLSAYVQN